jgi:hypothetical protein
VSATEHQRIEYDYDAVSRNKSAERYLTDVSGSYITKRSDSFAYNSDSTTFPTPLRAARGALQTRS